MAYLRVSKDGGCAVEMLPTCIDDHGLPMLADGDGRIFPA